MQIDASEQQWRNWINVANFMSEAVEISIYTTDGFFSVNYGDEKFMLGCLDDKYSLHFYVWSREKINTNLSSTYSLRNTGYNPWEQYLSHSFSKLHIKMLARAGSNGDPIATTSIYL